MTVFPREDLEICADCGFTRYQHKPEERFVPSGRFSPSPFIVAEITPPKEEP